LFGNTVKLLVLWHFFAINLKVVLDPYKEIERLSEIILEQSKVISELKARLDRYENPKNSSNSSIPPSHDFARPLRTKTLRLPSGKKQGGQMGHEGTTLQMTDSPDEVVEHAPLYCTCCGRDISQAQTSFVERRQEVVLPVVKPIFVEHRVFRRTCICGQTITSGFPSGITPGISYGENVETLAAYMSVRQYIPFHRLSEIFHDVFNLPISDGTLVKAVNRVARNSIPAYNLIRKRAETSKVSGGDETGMKLNGKKGWMWTIQGKLFTFVAASLNRGAQTLNEHFPDGFAFSVLVHDCWRCYFKVAALAHQICLAHLLRELNHINECYKLKWATDLKELFMEAMAFKKTLLPQDYRKTIVQRTGFEERLSLLLQKPIDEKHLLAIAFQNRMIKYRQHIFTFLYYHQVPPDNNGSERAIRNVKVKQKISGQFRSFSGAENFAILRSVIDTAIKNNQNPLVSLSQINAISLVG
jgi:transposase